MFILLLVMIFILGATIFWQVSLLVATVIGSPSVWSNQKAVIDTLALAKVKKNELVVDLGCGDGRSLITAAKKFQARGVGVDRSLYCWIVASLRVLLAGERCRIRIVRGDFKKVEAELKRADVVYLYLLHSTLTEIEKWFFGTIGDKTRVVSLAFEFPNRKPVDQKETWTLHKKTLARLYKK